MTDALHLSAQVLHASPGRVRLRVQREDLESAAMVQAERALTGLTGVQGVRKNPVTRSVLITFDAQAMDFEDLIVAAAEAGVVIEPAFEAPNVRSSRPIDQVITDFSRRVDERVRQGTGGTLDARTLLPIGLAALAARELMTTGLSAAPWYVLLWYSFDSFMKLRKPGASSNLP